MTTAKQKSVRDFRGRFKKKRYASPLEAREIFDRMYERGDREREAHLRTPEGERERQERNRQTLERLRTKKNPIRKQWIIELLHKNYGIWYITKGVSGGTNRSKNTTMRREAASKFSTETEASDAMKSALASFPATVRRNFVWIRTAVA